MKLMQTMTLLLLTVAVVLVTTAYTFRVGAFAAPEVNSAVDNAELQRIAQSRELEQQRTATLAPMVTLAQAAGLALPVLLGGVLLVGLTGGMALALYWGFNAAQRIRPDALGLYPVSQWALDEVARLALSGHFQARMIEAQRVNTPHSFTYAPRILRGRDGEALPGPDEALRALTMPKPPTFAQLLASGDVGPGKPLVLGYDEQGQAIKGTVSDLLSVGIGGQAGSGKTSLVRFLASQVALHGAQLVVLDPHYGAGVESLGDSLAPLASVFAVPIARADSEIRDTLHYVRAVLDARKVGKDASRQPLVVCCDEFTALMRGDEADETARLLEAIAQEGRKVNVFELLSGQVWKGTRAGGTELRDSLTARYCLRLRPTQARMLLGVYADELPRDTLALPVGEGYYMPRSGGIMRVAIPQATQEDVGRVVQWLPAACQTPARQASGNPAATHAPSNTDTVNTAQSRMVRELLARGVSHAAIIKQVWGASSGRAYTDGKRALESIIAALLGASP